MCKGVALFFLVTGVFWQMLVWYLLICADGTSP
jgi:hypothetical protein